MQFYPATDDSFTGLSRRLVSESGLVEIGVFQVMFGWRVRAGFCKSPCCVLDWCAGGNSDDLEKLYGICVAILSKRKEDKLCFDGLPGTSMVKPYFRDDDFVEQITRAANG
jgi:hypothetical protein